MQQLSQLEKDKFLYKLTMLGPTRTLNMLLIYESIFVMLKDHGVIELERQENRSVPDQDAIDYRFTIRLTGDFKEVPE